MTNNVRNVNIADLIFNAEIKAGEGKPNNKIDTAKEETIFKQELEEIRQKENLTEADVNEIWNVAINGINATSEVQSRNEIQLDKNQKKRCKTEILSDILKAIDKQSPLDWEALKANIKVELKVLADELYYQQLLGEVNKIVDTMKNVEFNSREDVEKLYVTSYKSLKDFPDDEFKSFRKDVLDNLIRAAEKEQMRKEKEQVLDEYGKLRTSGKTREDAVKEIRNNDKFKGSYFSDYLAYDVTESGKTVHAGNAPENKGVISLMEEGEVMTEARKEVWDVIYSLKNNPEVTERSDVKKRVKQAFTQADGNIDKYTQKVLNGERTFREKINAEPSITKAYMQKVATDNVVENLKQKGVNEKYFTDELKNDALFEAFKKAGLIEAKKTQVGMPINDEDGNQMYDLSKLSDLIREQLGANSKADKQLTEIKALSEIQQTLEKALAKIDNKYTKLSTKDTKRLIKLCGFPVEKKNWWKITMDALDKTFTMGLVGTAGALVTPREVARGTVTGTVSGVTTGDIPVSIEINDLSKTTLNLSFTGGGTLSLKDYMSLAKQVQAQGGTITPWADFQKTGVLQIMIDNSKNNSEAVLDKILHDKSLPFEEDYSKDYAKKAGEKTKRRMLINAMLFSLGTNFLMSALTYDKAEKPMIETQFKETNLEEYEKRIDASQTLTDNYKEGLKSLAKAFKDADGNWDVESYKQLLNKIAGDGGILNKVELEIGVFEAQKDFEKKLQEQDAKKPPVDKKPVEEVKPAPETAPVEEVKATEEVKSAPEDSVKFLAKQDINMKNSNKYYWEEIIQKFYGPALEAGVSERDIRFKLREVNNKILNSYKAIPPNLLIPEDLFGDGRCIRTEEKPDSEIKMRPRKKTYHPKVKAHRTPDGKWIGGHEYTENGTRKIVYNYNKKYNSEEEALKGAEEEYNKNKQK